MSDSAKLSRMALESGAIRLSPEKPFTWASGYKMPIYNDNRLLLGKEEYRSFISQIFVKHTQIHPLKSSMSLQEQLQRESLMPPP